MSRANSWLAMELDHVFLYHALLELDDLRGHELVGVRTWDLQGVAAGRTEERVATTLVDVIFGRTRFKLLHRCERDGFERQRHEPALGKLGRAVAEDQRE